MDEAGDTHVPPDPVTGAPAARGDLLPGMIIDGRYEIQRKLGRGGMGSVYVARHQQLDELLALKVISPEQAHDAGFRERFLREAKVAMAFVHRHSIPLRSFGVTPNGLHFMTMDFSNGVSLGQLLDDEGRLEPARAARIARMALAALAEAHRSGIVHRDLKPDNLMVEQRGGADFVRVLDFGLATLTDREDARITAPNTVMGSPHYMAPEQAAGEDVDHRADLYAIGVILFEMLSGTRPFQADSSVKVMRKHLTQPIPSVRERMAPTLCPPGLEAVITATLAKNADERFQSADELAHALAPFAGVDTDSASVHEQVRKRLAGSTTEPAPGERGPTGPTEALARSQTAPLDVAPRDPAARSLRPWAAALAVALLLGAGGAYWLAQQPKVDSAGEAVALGELATLLQSQRKPAGGYAESEDELLDPWITAEAVRALLLCPKKHRQYLGGVLEQLPNFALTQTATGTPARFEGFPNSVYQDNVACLEGTASVGIALALAKGRIPNDTAKLSTDVFEYLLRVQNADGSWASIPVLGEAAAMTGATAMAARAVLGLAVALDRIPEGLASGIRGARWLCGVLDPDEHFFNVNPRRTWGRDRHIPGLDEECALVLLEAIRLAKKTGRTPDPLVEQGLARFANAYRPSELPVDHVSRTRPEDYNFDRFLGSTSFQSTIDDDAWIVLPWRIWAADAIARMDGPNAAAWANEVLRLRAQLPGMVAAYRDAETWQIAEALLAVALVQMPEPPPGATRLLVDLVLP